MTRRAADALCVFRIHAARLRTEAGPFLLAALGFPAVMYMFASAVGDQAGQGTSDQHRLRFLAGSIVFSVSMTAVSWLGYLLLENRFTGRLRLFATLPLAPSSYVLGILVFALVQSAVGTITLLGAARLYGVRTAIALPLGAVQLAAVIILTVLCVSGIAVIIAARATSFSEGALLTDALGAGLVFLAPIYFPPDALPRALQLASTLLPTTYAARAVRTALAGSSQIGVDVLVLSGMALVALGVGFRVMRWRED